MGKSGENEREVWGLRGFFGDVGNKLTGGSCSEVLRRIQRKIPRDGAGGSGGEPWVGLQKVGKTGKKRKKKGIFGEFLKAGAPPKLENGGFGSPKLAWEKKREPQKNSLEREK